MKINFKTVDIKSEIEEWNMEATGMNSFYKLGVEPKDKTKTSFRLLLSNNKSVDEDGVFRNNKYEGKRYDIIILDKNGKPKIIHTNGKTLEYKSREELKFKTTDIRSYETFREVAEKIKFEDINGNIKIYVNPNERVVGMISDYIINLGTSKFFNLTIPYDEIKMEGKVRTQIGIRNMVDITYFKYKKIEVELSERGNSLVKQMLKMQEKMKNITAPKHTDELAYSIFDIYKSKKYKGYLELIIISMTGSIHRILMRIKEARNIKELLLNNKTILYLRYNNEDEGELDLYSNFGRTKELARVDERGHISKNKWGRNCRNPVSNASKKYYDRLVAKI